MRITRWAEEYLLLNGYTINAPLEHVRTTPWSSVTRFVTSAGHIYLKQTPPMLSLEPIITQILYDQFHANVPAVIAINKDLHCFLMKDSGKPLREIFNGTININLLSRGIKAYTFVQCAVAEHINTFLDLGVPDWRLEKLPTLYSELISRADFLIEDGMTIDEVNMLHKLQPKFASMCELLSGYKIAETLDHCDFHDNNILMGNNANKMTIIDWGESAITHPFFSLFSCLSNAAYRYGLNGTEAHVELQEACLDCDLFNIEQEKLSEAFLLATRLWPIYSSLGNYRLTMSSDIEELKSYSDKNFTHVGRLARVLKVFVATEKNGKN